MRRVSKKWIGAGAVAMALLLVPVGARAFLDTDAAWTRLFGYLLSFVSEPGEYEVMVGRVTNPLSGTVTLENVTVADRQGTWFSLDRAVLQWRPSRLLLGEMVIDDLQLDRPVLSRLPPASAEQAVAGERPENPLQLPELPQGVDIHRVRLNDGVLGAAVLGERLTYRGQGRLVGDDAGTQLDLALTRTDRAPDDASDGEADGIELGYRYRAGAVLRIDLLAREAPGGIVARQAGLSLSRPLRLEIHGDGSPADWAASLTARLGDYVSGEARVSAAWADRVRVSADGAFSLGPDAPAALRASGRRIELDVRIATRPDGTAAVERAFLTSPAARLSLTGTMSPGRDFLDGVLTAAVEDQTAFDALLPDGVAIAAPTVRVAFSGPVDTLSYDVAVAAARVAAPDAGASDIGATLSLRPQPGGALAVTLDAAAAAPVVPGVDTARLLGARVALAARGRLSAGYGELRLPEISLTAAGGRFTGNAILDTARVTATGGGALEIPDLGALNGLAGTTLSGAATFTLADVSYRPGGALAAGLAGTVGGLSVGDGAARFDAAGPIELAARIDADTAAGRYEVGDLRVSGGGMMLSGALAANLSEGTATGGIDARIDDLRLVPHLGSRLAGGRLRLGLAFADRATDRTLRGDFTAAADGLVFADDALSLAVGSAPRLKGTVSRGADGLLAIGIAEIETAAGQASGTIRVAPADEKIAAALDLRMDRLAALSGLAGVDLAGGARGRLTLDGRLSAPDGALTMATSRLRIAGIDMGDVGGRITTSPARAGQRIAAELKVSDAAAGPGDISAAATLGRDGGVRVEKMSVNAYGIDARGTASIGAQGPVAADLAVRIPQLQVAGLLFGVAGLGGGLDGTLSLGGTDSGPVADIEFTATAPSLTPGGADAPAVAAKKAVLTARIADPFGKRRLAATLAVDDVTAGPRAFDTVRLDLTGEAMAPAFEAKIAGDKMDMELAGGADLGAAGPRVRIDRLEGVLAGQPVALRRPLDIALGDRPAVGPVALRLGGGSLDGFFRREGKGYRVELVADAVPLSFAEVAEPGLLLDGTLSGTAKANTAAARGSADIRVGLRDMKLREAGIDAPAMAADLEVRWDGEAAVADLALKGLGDRPLLAKAQARLGIDRAGLPLLEPGAPLRGTVSWTGPVGGLWDYVPLSDHLLAGRAIVDVVIGGTVAAPALSGRLALEDGVYEHLVAGTAVRDLTLTVTSRDARAFDIALRGTDGGKGRFVADGRLDVAALLGGDSGATADVSFTARDAVVVRRDELVANIDSDLTLRNFGDRLRLSGSVAVNRAEARLIDDLPPSVAELPVVEINRPGAAGRAGRGKPPPDRTPSLPLEVDIVVRAPQELFVRGRGLDSEWGGELQISGGDPVQVVGDIVARRGQFDLGGKAFRLVNSRIVFPAGEIAPRADVTATYDGPDIQASIHLRGPAASPTLSLSSVPPYPEDEILSRALFNQAPQSLGAVQAATLASSAATLAGIGGGDGVLGQVRQKLGIDVLRLSNDSSGGPGVTVGKYIADNVFIGATQGAAAGSTAAKVEVEITDNIKIESDVGATSGSNIGLNWEWKY